MATRTPLVELRSLDPEVKIRGARRLCLEIDDAAGANPAFEQVLIVENHTTFLALPELPGTFAVWGEGYRADELVAALPWLAQRRVFYWGDLDSHGFRILDRIRGALPGVRSVLMDSETARMHLELAVEEPTATAFTPAQLTDDEALALELLRDCEAHSSVILSNVDTDVFKKLGVNITFEAKYQAKKLFHKK